MCEFISAIKDKEDYFYLTKQDLKGKKFNEYKKFNANWKEDIKGHGAIEYFYPEVKGKGEHWECVNFSSPKNFPECIVDDIKKGNFEGIGICLNILNEKGNAEYNKIEQPALAEYNKINQPAWAEYDKIEQSALAEYNKIHQLALAEYNKIEQFAWAEYDKIEQSARAEYNKIEQSAWAEYNKIQQSAFWQIAKQKKYRTKEWNLF